MPCRIRDGRRQSAFRRQGGPSVVERELRTGDRFAGAVEDRAGIDERGVLFRRLDVNLSGRVRYSLRGIRERPLLLWPRFGLLIGFVV